jgi:putative flippase GtrA
LAFIRDVYARFRLLFHEVAKFGIVGGIGFVVQLGTTDGLHYGPKVGPSTAVVAGYIVATVVTFLGNKFWTYRHRTGNSGVARESAMFILLNVVGIVLQLAVVDLVTYGMDRKDPFSYNVALIIGIGLGTIFRLFTYRRFVFKSTPAAPVGMETLVPDGMLSAAGHGYQPEWGAQYMGGLGNGQVAHGNHPADHVFEPDARGGRVQHRVVNGRRVHHTGQHRRLRH